MSPKPAHSNQWHVGLIGYGEVGRILAEDLRKDGVRVSAYDIKLGAGRPRRWKHGKICVALPRRMRLARRPITGSAVTASWRCRWRRPASAIGRLVP
jgi:3-hydroxyisobutyrate dehydrogenase-like beta-hydroxyacid dehydrogenase